MSETAVLVIAATPGEMQFSRVAALIVIYVILATLRCYSGEFEAGFEADGQTKEHAILARALGITRLIIAINKVVLPYFYVYLCHSMLKIPVVAQHNNNSTRFRPIYNLSVCNLVLFYI